MSTYNKVIMMGNLTRDPESKYLGQTALCEFGLAVNRKYKSAAGEQKEDVCFVDIKVWGKQAESCQQYLNKGSAVLVDGELRLETWDDKTSGSKRSKHTITAESVKFMSSKPVDDLNGPAQSQPAPQTANIPMPDSEGDEIPF